MENMKSVRRVPPLLRLPKMNKTEARYAQQLELMKRAGEILDWKYEAMKFRLAHKTFYTPDFMIVHMDCIEFVEIKGFLRDDAAVKYKTAREIFPWFKWDMLRLKRGAWSRVNI